MEFLDNLASIAWAIIKAPLKESTVQLYTYVYYRGVRPGGSGVSRTPSKREVLTHNYKLLILVTVAIAVASGLAEIILAAVWSNPTANQQTAFAAMDFAWKAGIGALFGLISGKAT
jgi:hypothetical protein